MDNLIYQMCEMVYNLIWSVCVVKIKCSFNQKGDIPAAKLQTLYLSTTLEWKLQH